MGVNWLDAFLLVFWCTHDTELVIDGGVVRGVVFDDCGCENAWIVVEQRGGGV
jgi:hypothetical protein